MADKDNTKGGSSKPPTGALNVERRTWDVEHFEKLAREKAERVCVYLPTYRLGVVVVCVCGWDR